MVWKHVCTSFLAFCIKHKNTHFHLTFIICKKMWKSLFWPALGVLSTLMLVKICNRCHWTAAATHVKIGAKKICFLRVDPQKSKSSFVSPTKNCWFGLRGFALWELQTNSFFHYSLALHVWQKNGLGTWNNWKLIPLFNKLKQAWSGSKLAAKQFKLSGKILMEMCQWHILSNIILAE